VVLVWAGSPKSRYSKRRRGGEEEGREAYGVTLTFFNLRVLCCGSRSEERGVKVLGGEEKGGKKKKGEEGRE